MRLLLLLSVFFASSLCFDSFNGHQVIKFKIATDGHASAIKSLQDTIPGLDFWTLTATVPGELIMRIPPAAVETVFKTADLIGMEYSVYIENLEELVQEERVREQESRANGAGFFSKYATYSEMLDYLNNLHTTYSDLVSKPFSLGESVEGRQLMAVSITSGGQRGSKPIIFYNGCQHAREWITLMTVAYIADSLASNYTSNSAVKDMVDNFEWVLLPITNPDGYNYTWTDNRMWRKNRANHGGLCRGVDINRNWDDHWCQDGSSHNSCSDEYCGPSAFSEPENAAVAKYVKANNVLGYIDFHSFSQLMLSPYGWTKTPPPDYKDHEAMMKEFCGAVKNVHGKTYQYGPIYTTIYPASGSSIDYSYTEAGVKYAFGMELRDTGEHGFVLPPEEIIPQGQEIFAGVMSMAKYLQNN